MDWLEKLFGLNLDGGDGSAETMVVIGCAIIVAGLIAARRPLRRLLNQRARRSKPVSQALNSAARICARRDGTRAVPPRKRSSKAPTLAFVCASTSRTSTAPSCSDHGP